MNNIPGFNEEFLDFESKVTQVMKLLDDISNANKREDELASKPVQKDIMEEIDEKNFVITVKEDRSVLNRNVLKEDEKKELAESNASDMDKFTFMQQMEKDADERAKSRRERERIAQNFRSLGNEAYRKQNYEKAINMYTKAIDHIKDSPILYNNRALCYLKIKNFKRGIMDCDYVINKLEEKNIRSWLYRASGYKRLGDEKNFETSVRLARKNNPKKYEYIDNFLEKIRIDPI